MLPYKIGAVFHSNSYFTYTGHSPEKLLFQPSVNLNWSLHIMLITHDTFPPGAHKVLSIYWVHQPFLPQNMDETYQEHIYRCCFFCCLTMPMPRRNLDDLPHQEPKVRTLSFAVPASHGQTDSMYLPFLQ